MIERHRIENDEQWQRLRARDVTASVVGALFGVHPYVTMGRLHVDKVDGPMFAEIQESAVMRRGRALERVVADEVVMKFARVNASIEVEKAYEYFRDPDVRVGATPDYFITLHDPRGRGILQCKTVGSLQFKKEWSEDSMPLWISLQIATEMMLTESQWGIVGVLVIGDFTYELHTYSVERIAGVENRIRQGVRKFWQDIADGKEPQVDYQRDGELIRAMFPREAAGKILDLSGDNRIPELLERRDMLRLGIKQVEADLEAIDNELKHKIGDAEQASARGWLMTYKSQHRREYTVPASDIRVFRVKRET